MNYNLISENPESTVVAEYKTARSTTYQSEAAKLYYTESQKQMETLPPDKRLKIATIYSYAANEADDGNGFMGDENSENTDSKDKEHKGYRELVELLLQKYPIGGHTCGSRKRTS